MHRFTTSCITSSTARRTISSGLMAILTIRLTIRPRPYPAILAPPRPCHLAIHSRLHLLHRHRPRCRPLRPITHRLRLRRHRHRPRLLTMLTSLAPHRRRRRRLMETLIPLAARTRIPRSRRPTLRRAIPPRRTPRSRRIPSQPACPRAVASVAPAPSRLALARIATTPSRLALARISPPRRRHKTS